MTHAAICAVSSTAVTPEEQAISYFTRRRLKTLSTWKEWEKGERKQLNHFEEQGMFGPPQVAPKGAIISSPHWTIKKYFKI